jgi:SM-20-related protein
MSIPIRVYDNILLPDDQQHLWDYLRGPGWAYGAHSNKNDSESYRYWYKHFAGFFDNLGDGKPEQFEQQLLVSFPGVAKFWQGIQQKFLQGHRLFRCYANGYPYGVEGTLHVDVEGTVAPGEYYTALYYPHLDWSPDYGGETVFFNDNKDEIACAIYPKPNRLVVFASEIQHVARGVTRRCPHLRITLMFKTQKIASVSPQDGA